MISREQLAKLAPHAGSRVDVFLDPLNAAMEEFGINTDARRSAFLAQVIHESDQLAAVSENLNYGANALMRTWPKRFPNSVMAAAYERQPEKIANFVYANRMGNGALETGDGFKFRGAGLLQLTGKDAHQACAEYFGISIDGIGEWLRSPEGACRSAAWFWQRNGLSTLADAGDIQSISKRINGGAIGIEQRLALFGLAKQVLA
jgi:putative chitinase